MKGLLLKDYYTLLKQAKIFVFIIIIFSAIPNVSMTGFSVFYAAMLPITALAYDERAKWDSLAAMMPYSKRDIVFSKYLLGYIGIAAVGILASAARLAIGTIQHATSHTVQGAAQDTAQYAAASPDAFLSILLILCAAAVMLAVNLPVMFKSGVEKGKITLFVLIGAVVVAGMIFGQKAIGIMSTSMAGLGTVVIISVVFTIVLNIISVMLSTAFYKHRSF